MKKIEPKIEDIYDYDYYPYGHNFMLLEEGDSWSDLYDKGYLPIFTKESAGDSPNFYLNRSVRVDLKNFDMNSENRRIDRKTQYLDFYTLDEKKHKYDPVLEGKLCRDWFAARFPDNPMHISKIKRIFTGGINNFFFVFSDIRKGGNIGYAATVLRDNILHYSSPFYNPDYYKQNLGIGMMLKAIVWAKEKGLDYIYLGTCNSEAALYKLQFKGVEWFDGKLWSQDIAELKKIIRKK